MIGCSVGLAVRRSVPEPFDPLFEAVDRLVDLRPSLLCHLFCLLGGLVERGSDTLQRFLDRV